MNASEIKGLKVAKKDVLLKEIALHLAIISEMQVKVAWKKGAHPSGPMYCFESAKKDSK